MITLRLFSENIKTIPTGTAWYISDLSEARGKQELFTKQSPQRLKVLREHALIESAISSNRIEGVEVDKKRIGTLLFGRPHFRDRDEEEVRGYRDALKLIHERPKKLPVTQKTVRDLHRLVRGDIWDAGKYKNKDSDIIERSADGSVRVRFKTVSAARTASAMGELVNLWDRCNDKRRVPSLLLVAAFNLDFLCIHPFRDGNGRVSRLLLLLQCYDFGFEVGRYISLERIIEENKERYYETLEESSRRWHEGKHDPWPYINFLLFILKTAYKEFEERVGKIRSPKGTKTERVAAAVNDFKGTFTLLDVERACPGVSHDMIRWVLRDLKRKGRVECLGRGPGAPWRKKGNTLKRG